MAMTGRNPRSLKAYRCRRWIVGARPPETYCEIESAASHRDDQLIRPLSRTYPSNVLIEGLRSDGELKMKPFCLRHSFPVPLDGLGEFSSDQRWCAATKPCARDPAEAMVETVAVCQHLYPSHPHLGESAVQSAMLLSGGPIRALRRDGYRAGGRGSCLNVSEGSESGTYSVKVRGVPASSDPRRALTDREKETNRWCGGDGERAVLRPLPLSPPNGVG
eukprot:2446667-Rhodomonas_salina.4